MTTHSSSTIIASRSHCVPCPNCVMFGKSIRKLKALFADWMDELSEQVDLPNQTNGDWLNGENKDVEPVDIANQIASRAESNGLEEENHLTEFAQRNSSFGFESDNYCDSLNSEISVSNPQVDGRAQSAVDAIFSSARRPRPKPTRNRVRYPPENLNECCSIPEPVSIVVSGADVPTSGNIEQNAVFEKPNIEFDSSTIIADHEHFPIHDSMHQNRDHDLKFSTGSDGGFSSDFDYGEVEGGRHIITDGQLNKEPERYHDFDFKESELAKEVDCDPPAAGDLSSLCMTKKIGQIGNFSQVDLSLHNDSESEIAIGAPESDLHINEMTSAYESRVDLFDDHVPVDVSNGDPSSRSSAKQSVHDQPMRNWANGVRYFSQLIMQNCAQNNDGGDDPNDVDCPSPATSHHRETTVFEVVHPGGTIVSNDHQQARPNLYISKRPANNSEIGSGITKPTTGGTKGGDEVLEILQGSHICHLCGKSYLNQNSLRGHIRWSHTETQFGSRPCPVCRKEFKTKKSLHRHYREVHTFTESPIKCSHCGKQFDRVTCYDTHRKRCGVKPKQPGVFQSGNFRCPYPTCQRSFQRLCNLRQHMNDGTHYSANAEADGAVMMMPKLKRKKWGHETKTE